ncbi:MAG TPA: hydrogenase maturation protease [Bryobacteraceae bacterium]|nr:hydrogenase maturation protease [Bryobacteraceae bacterium]
MLIIGCGNTDRGDDAAGILVARKLRLLGLDALEHSGDGLALLDLWNGFEDVVLVDAMVGGGSPGSITVWEDASTRGSEECPVSNPEPVDEGVGRGPGGPPHWAKKRILNCSSTHAYGPSEAIELARVLGRLPSRMRVYGIEASQFQHGAAVTSEVLAAVDLVVGEIAQGCSKGTKLQ